MEIECTGIDSRDLVAPSMFLAKSLFRSSRAGETTLVNLQKKKRGGKLRGRSAEETLIYLINDASPSSVYEKYLSEDLLTPTGGLYVLLEIETAGVDATKAQVVAMTHGQQHCQGLNSEPWGLETIPGNVMNYGRERHRQGGGGWRDRLNESSTGSLVRPLKYNKGTIMHRTIPVDLGLSRNPNNVA